MPRKLRYAIEYVEDMSRAVKFYREAIGLTVKFESAGWSEFANGETTFALHPASKENPAGKIELGITVEDIQAACNDLKAQEVEFLM
jgi:predicted enzyme related to lactoylglutathione lyase